MPKRVPDSQTVDPVRSRLAASAASETVAPSPRPVSLVETRTPEASREEARREPPEPESRPRKEKLTVNRKVMFAEDEAQRNADTTAMISSAFGSQATYSQITRAMWSILAGAEDAIKAGRSKRTRRLSVPSKGDHIAMAEYEEALAQFLSAAIRRS